MKTLLHIAVAYLLTWGECIAESPARHQTYEIEAIESLPLNEVWALGEPQQSAAGDVMVLTQRYDPEFGFKRHDLKYCAVVMIGSMDIGARPIGLRLLAPVECPRLKVST